MSIKEAEFNVIGIDLSITTKGTKFVFNVTAKRIKGIFCRLCCCFCKSRSQLYTLRHPVWTPKTQTLVDLVITKRELPLLRVFYVNNPIFVDQIESIVIQS